MAEKSLRMNQVIAITNGEKSRKQKVLSKVYQELQHSTLFEGFTKRYAPLDEEGERLPSEDKKVQMTVQQATKEAIEVMENMFNIVAMQDLGNCAANASVIVDDTTILKDVPATYLIFLEKQLIDIEVFVNSFPVLDPAEDWEWSDKTACYESKPKESHRTKKIQDVLVKYAATKEHPAQTELITKDILTGYWTTIKFSGNIKKTDKDAILERVRKISKAVKVAREEANNIAVEHSTFGTDILNYIFGK
jgi:hypothetical protein